MIRGLFSCESSAASMLSNRDYVREAGSDEIVDKES